MKYRTILKIVCATGATLRYQWPCSVRGRDGRAGTISRDVLPTFLIRDNSASDVVYHELSHDWCGPNGIDFAVIYLAWCMDCAYILGSNSLIGYIVHWVSSH